MELFLLKGYQRIIGNRLYFVTHSINDDFFPPMQLLYAHDFTNVQDIRGK